IKPYVCFRKLYLTCLTKLDSKCHLPGQHHNINSGRKILLVVSKFKICEFSIKPKLDSKYHLPYMLFITMHSANPYFTRLHKTVRMFSKIVFDIIEGQH
ncbi:hypothetical protein ACJX0J_020953, partial [Zea mays]